MKKHKAGYLLGVVVIAWNWAAVSAADSIEPCSWAPRCVSSSDSGRWYYVAPIVYDVPHEDALHVLRAIVEAYPRAKLEEDDGTRLHATFRTRIFRFTDDVEFVVVREEKKIHVRSASRVGLYDWGVNRRRVEAIRDRFREAVTPE